MTSWPEAWAEIWEKSVSWVLGPRKTVEFRGSPKPGQWHCGRCRTGFGADEKVSIERWYLSPYVEKHFNSKVIKSFVPELSSRECFSWVRDSYVLSIYVRYEQSMYISRGYVTHTHTHTHTHIHTHIYIYIYSDEREREREREMKAYFDVERNNCPLYFLSCCHVTGSVATSTSAARKIAGLQLGSGEKRCVKIILPNIRD